MAKNTKNKAKNLTTLLVLPLLVASIYFITPTNPVKAASITVTTTADELNADGDCSLREAIQSANSDTAIDACTAGSDTDSILLPAGTYTMSIAEGGTPDDNTNTGGDFDITSNILILPENTNDYSNTIIEGTGSDRIFQVHSGGTLTLSNVTVRNGNSAGNGGAVLVNTGGNLYTTTDAHFTNNAAVNGGAFFCGGYCDIFQTVFTNNSATTIGGTMYVSNVVSSPAVAGQIRNSQINGGSALAGGFLGINTTGASGQFLIQDVNVSNTSVTVAGSFIYNVNSTINILRSSFGNGTDSSAPNTSIDTGSGGTTNIQNSTIYNSGQIYSDASTINLTHVTAILNTDAAVNAQVSGNITLVNTILVSANTACVTGGTATITANNYNISQTNCPAFGANDINNTNPGLEGTLTTLTSNNTQTYRPALATSPIVDTANPVLVIAQDQDGVTRPLDGNGDTVSRADIGAYEYTAQVAPVITMVTPIPAFTNDNTPSFTFNSSEITSIDSFTCTLNSNSITLGLNDGTYVAGNQTVTVQNANNAFPYPLGDGSYTCQFIVHDVTGIDSNTLTFSFVIDTTAPVIAETAPITSPTTDTTPSFTFSSTEAGTITYAGSCSSTATTAFAGNNTVEFNTLALGTYTDCTITLTDAAGNVSAVLTVSPFTISATVTSTPTPSSSPTSIPTLPNTGDNVVSSLVIGGTGLLAAMSYGVYLTIRRRFYK